MSDSNDFIEIEDFKNDIYRIITEIEGKCDSLENIYKEYLKQATKTKDYLNIRFKCNLKKPKI